MLRLPNEIPTKDVSENLGRYTCGYVQQRISGALEFDHVPIALFDPLLQGSYRIDVGLATHASVRFASVREMRRNLLTYIDIDVFSSFWGAWCLFCWVFGGTDMVG